MPVFFMTNFIYEITDIIFSNSQIFDKFRNFVHNNFKDEKNIVKKYFNKDKLTLDFGCGAGQFSELFNPNNYYGIDTDIRYIKFCKNSRKGNFSLISNPPHYNFKSKFFEQILISAVIHHINDKTLFSILKDLKRNLKDNGKIIIIDHFTKKHQKNILCRFLINLDRGNNFRNLNEIMSICSKHFKIKKSELFKNSLYEDYALILGKK